MTTTAKIASKGCSSTGITEELAKLYHDNLGRKVLAIVELVADNRGEKLNGDDSVGLSILTIEPAPTKQTEDHLRELARAFHFERRLKEGDAPTLDGTDDLEPKVADVLQMGAALRPHEPMIENGSTKCEVCGKTKAAKLHNVAT